MPSTTEKRKHSRLAVADFQIKATLAVISGNRTAAHLVLVKDISKRGVAVYLKAPLEKGTQFRISVEGFSHVPLPGVVSWCSTAEDDPLAAPTYPYAAGLELVPLDDETRDSQLSLFVQIEAFMKRRLGQ